MKRMAMKNSPKPIFLTVKAVLGFTFPAIRIGCKIIIGGKRCNLLFQRGRERIISRIPAHLFGNIFL
jgi:hypothetical protein